MEESKSSADAAESTSNQATGMINPSDVVIERPSGEGSVQAMESTSNQVTGMINPSGVVIEKPSEEGSVQAMDAGTSHLVQVRNQPQKSKLKKRKRLIKVGQKNVGKASSSSVENKAEDVNKHNQNNAEKASSSNAVNTGESTETSHSAQVRTQNKRRRFGKDTRQKEDGKKNDETLPTFDKGKKPEVLITDKLGYGRKPEEIITNKLGDENKEKKSPYKELNGDLSKKANNYRNVLGEDLKRKDKRPHNQFGGDVKRKDKIPRNQIGGDVKRKDNKPPNELGGVIFMCNARTKPDCFRYRVLGVSANKKELVLSIKPGLKLFLYDFDMKLMYGVYKASSAGGMKLEPAAFGGAFPAQVRFDVEKDGLPLPEGVFKKAIRDSYDERTRKFQTELTFKQANCLAELFSPAPWLHLDGKPSHQEHSSIQTIRSSPAVNSINGEITREKVYTESRGRLVPLDYERQHRFPEHHASRLDVQLRHPVSRQEVFAHRPASRHEALPNRPLFLTEKEYRSYGLQQGRSEVRTAPVNVDDALPRREVVDPDQRVLDESEYRTYPLRRPEFSIAMDTRHALEDQNKETFNPYDASTTSLVNRYLSMPRMTGTDAGSYSVSRGETFVNFPNYSSVSSGQPERVISNTGLHVIGNTGTLRSLYDSRAPAPAVPEYDPRYRRLGQDPGMVPPTVASRYSFGGPSSLHR